MSCVFPFAQEGGVVVLVPLRGAGWAVQKLMHVLGWAAKRQVTSSENQTIVSAPQGLARTHNLQ